MGVAAICKGVPSESSRVVGTNWRAVGGRTWPFRKVQKSDVHVTVMRWTVQLKTSHGRDSVPLSTPSLPLLPLARLSSMSWIYRMSYYLHVPSFYTEYAMVRKDYDLSSVLPNVLSQRRRSLSSSRSHFRTLFIIFVESSCFANAVPLEGRKEQANGAVPLLAFLLPTSCKHNNPPTFSSSDRTRGRYR